MISSLDQYHSWILERIQAAQTNFDPFGHLYIQNVFPNDLYESILARSRFYKKSGQLQRRTQDSKLYVNNRVNLIDNDDHETHILRRVFESASIKRALLEKFYSDVDDAAVDALSIHSEFEYVFTAAGLFQNIHVDIPAKYLSLVFYLPDGELSEEEQRKNATVLYDRELNPSHRALYAANSVCVFAPHYYSYHGFSTTVERTSLVLFYVDRELLARYNSRRHLLMASHLKAFKRDVDEKLSHHTLIEYGEDPLRLSREREACMINAREGRVMNKADQSFWERHFW